jgi:predicted HAD superfamily Cof-like phosphohydrolase
MSEYILPVAGTPAHAEFVRRAKDPNSFEGKLAAQMVSQAVEARSQHIREMLRQMIELVPGQLFRDIEAFHRKFGLEPTDDPGHRLPDDVLEFRIQFMLEELLEYASAVGFGLADGRFIKAKSTNLFDAEEAFDGLVDLTVVCLGTAYLHAFNFNAGWERVMEANMKKVRAESANDPRSKRKQAYDIVKPTGWKKPVLSDLL